MASLDEGSATPPGGDAVISCSSCVSRGSDFEIGKQGTSGSLNFLYPNHLRDPSLTFPRTSPTMKSILRKMSIAGSKRRLSFAPGVKEPEEELPPPSPPDFLMPGPSDAPAGEPVPVAGRSADPTAGVPGDSLVPRPGQVVIVKDDDDFLRGVLSDEGWPMKLGPFLIAGAVMLGIATIAVLISYTAVASSGTIVPPTPLKTDITDVGDINLTSVASTGLLCTLATRGHGRKDEDGEYGTEVSDYSGTQTGLDDINATWDNADDSVADRGGQKVQAGARLVSANDSEMHAVHEEDKVDPTRVHAVTRNLKTAVTWNGTATGDPRRRT